MKLNKVLSVIIFYTILFWQFGCMAQKKMDLAKVKFTENISDFVNGVQNVQQGTLGGKKDMISYGFNNDGRFTFATLAPKYLELISWKGKLVGFALKMKSFTDQQKIETYFKNTYKKSTIHSSKFITVYTYNDEQVSAELRLVSEEKYKEGANGYLDIKRIDFAKEFLQMTKR